MWRAKGAGTMRGARRGCGHRTAVGWVKPTICCWCVLRVIDDQRGFHPPYGLLLTVRPKSFVCRIMHEGTLFNHKLKEGIVGFSKGWRPKFIAMSLIVVLFTPGLGLAGGLLGDALNNVLPGAGTALDDLHDEFKDAVPPYKQIEEGASQAVNEVTVQATAPLLQELIARSRDEALSAGVSPVPESIRANLQGFIPSEILNVARYRVGGGGDLTLQVNAIRYGEAAAITLDYVIVFASDNDALYNPTLWTHELTHVGQYQRWGIGDFAIRYVRSYESVESEAYEAETRFAAWVAQSNSKSFAGNGQDPALINRPLEPFFGAGNSNLCGTAFGGCNLGETAPVGTPCWCNTQSGPATGSLVPASDVSMVPSGLPPGTPMLSCGCWGPSPTPSAYEPRCSSQTVVVSVCNGFCAPGHPLYGYVCSQ